MQNQFEITTKQPLLNDDGNIATPGYATKLNWEYDRTQVKASKSRIKEWEYYSISNGEFALGVTFADMGYVGALTVSVVDFVTPAYFSSTATKFFTMGKMNMPTTLDGGDISFKKGKIWATITMEDGKRRLQGEYPNADGRDNTLKWDVLLTDTPQDCMAIATPFDKDKHFYLNGKVNCIKAKGQLSINDMVCPFDEDKTLATLDWGRGVWTYKNTWYWASLSTNLDDGTPFGLNLGYGFGNTENATEDMIFVDGKAHKILTKVAFEIQGETDGKPRFIEPWTIKSEDDKIHLTFTPIIDKNDPFNIGIVKMDGHQVFGWYDGTCTLDDGKVIEINHKIGFAEKVKTKW